MSGRKKTRTQKAALNIVFSTIHEVVGMACALILPRFVLRSFGSTYNGVLSSVSQFLSFISVLSLGVTASTRVALYRSFEEKDPLKTSAIVKAMDRYMKRVGWVLLGYILLLAAVYPLVVTTNIDYVDVAVLIAIVGVSSFAEYFFGITYKTVLAADQRGYINNIFMTAATVINTILSVILIKKGCSIQIVKLGSAVIFLLRPIIQNIYVVRRYHIVRNCQPDNTALKRKNDAAAHALANIVHEHTDIVILTLFADIKTVSVYTVYNLVMVALKKIQTILTTGLEPTFGNMWVRGETDKIRKNLSIFEFVITVFVSLAFSVAMVMILPFISLYTKGVHDIEYIVPVYAAVIILAFTFQGFRAPYLALVQGIGHYKETRNGAIMEAVINVVLSVVLVNIIGMVGVAVGTLAANLYRTILYACYIDDNVIPRGKSVFVRKILWSLGNLIVVVIPMYLWISRITSWTWMKWVGFSFLTAAVSLAVIAVSSVVFYRDDLRETLKLARRMAKKFFK